MPRGGSSVRVCRAAGGCAVATPTGGWWRPQRRRRACGSADRRLARDGRDWAQASQEEWAAPQEKRDDLAMACGRAVEIPPSRRAASSGSGCARGVAAARVRRCAKGPGAAFCS
ncbi:hypothetical protein PLESTM_001326200 [Pleodorina starrii]|nr:hypothetical protein PLESTM_001326200 [Pleodorina starrii]